MGRCAHCWIRWKINFSIFIFLVIFIFWVIVFTIFQWRIGLFKCVTDHEKRSFKGGQIYRKGAQCAETNKKSFFRFLGYDRFCTQNSSKIDRFCVQNRSYLKSWKLFQHILHLSCKYRHFKKMIFFNHLAQVPSIGRNQINTKKKYFIVVHISTWSLWNMGRFRWKQSWYPGRNRRKTHTKLFLNSSQSFSVLSLYSSQAWKAHLT